MKNIGKHTVIMGNISSGIENIGEGCTIIGLTDANGNVILNTPIAVGYGAQAGTNSIAIGAFANAGGGFNLPATLEQLKLLAEKTNDSELLNNITTLISEFNKQAPDKGNISKILEYLAGAANFATAFPLIEKIKAFFS